MTLEEKELPKPLEADFIIKHGVGILATDGRYYHFSEVITLLKKFSNSQTQQLTAWKESASKVFKNLDLQTLGKTLGIGLGEDVSTNVLPKIKELQEQNAELVEMLKEIVLYDCDNYISSGDIDKIKELLTKHNHLKSNTN